ncbi:NAD-dependent epimerase/dehydratase [Methylocella silvestris BL2]|uniref:NAD-dependent epimerase/dehydratase n=1 Tax=Methylocella silvestris (strain DSM 15510 / CIP 108128 / LMG 27833 / NCIMB 13906 / BL2) TaxID=395965 RepID=B8EK44_METSB|nr:NAD-dependent epimerase/dehydratase family protein [Methylocella silvestris]ACK50584.1 NAD-dependent epimerase/dehydratase [Methylocella silvestris BL2]
MSGSHTRIALVIGAAGGVGGETSAALARHGWRVRGLTRRPQPANAAIEWIAGDAMNAADVLRAAQGASLIVHAANPPGYRNWDTLVLPMLDHAIAAAKAVGARIVLPGTVYNFGADAFPVLREDSPQHPTTRKGAIRVEMEKRLKAAAGAGAPALIVRGGDWFGPKTTANSYFTAVMVRPGAPVKWIVDPARRCASHAWGYLPDVGETIARLMDRETALSDFEMFHFAGHQLQPGEMAAAIAKAAGNPHVRVWPFPWPLVVALQPFVRLFHELAELRYLWSQSISLDGGKLKAFLGADLPATPLDIAVRDTLVGLGCLSQTAPD